MHRLRKVGTPVGPCRMCVSGLHDRSAPGPWVHSEFPSRLPIMTVDPIFYATIRALSHSHDTIPTRKQVQVRVQIQVQVQVQVRNSPLPSACQSTTGSSLLVEGWMGQRGLV